MDIAYINSLPSYHRAKFEIEKDDPQTQGLLTFIRSTLLKNLNEVNTWKIHPYIHGRTPEDARAFHLELTNGRQIGGMMHRQRDGQGREVWTIGDDWRTVF